MNDESSAIQLAQDIGSLKQRLESLEKALVILSTEVKPTETHKINQFSYPFEIDWDEYHEASMGELRSIKSTTYDIYIAKPHPDMIDDTPRIYKYTINRNELDWYLSQIPNETKGEWIYKLIPTYESQL
jgi:hypothetical protein